MDKLRNDGFILIENNSQKKKFYNSLNKFYKNNKVNYILLKEFIDKEYYPKLKSICNFKEKHFYEKFKFNDNKFNSNTFHSDIYNHTNENIINIYTCLYYFDNAQLEIIPKSHRKDYIMNHNFSTSYKNKKKIFINSGTFVILHSNVHYRELIISNNTRFIQIYNVFFTKNDYNNYISKLIIIRNYDSFIVNNLRILLKKIIKNNDVTPFIHYFLVYYDLQYKIGLFSSDLSPSSKNNKLISYEIEKRIMYEKNTISNTNINIICSNIYNCGPGNFYFIFYISYLVIILSILFYMKS